MLLTSYPVRAPSPSIPRMTYAVGESAALFISREDTSLRYICQLYLAKQLARDRPCLPRAAGDHEARVIPGQGAEHTVVLEPVERTRDRRRGPELAADDDEVLRSNRAPTELRENGDERIARIASRRPRQRVARLAERVAHLPDAEIADVPRHRRRQRPCSPRGVRAPISSTLASQLPVADHAVSNRCRSCLGSGAGRCMGGEYLFRRLRGTESR